MIKMSWWRTVAIVIVFVTINAHSWALISIIPSTAQVQVGKSRCSPLIIVTKRCMAHYVNSSVHHTTIDKEDLVTINNIAIEQTCDNSNDKIVRSAVFNWHDPTYRRWLGPQTLGHGFLNPRQGHAILSVIKGGECLCVFGIALSRFFPGVIVEDRYLFLTPDCWGAVYSHRTYDNPGSGRFAKFFELRVSSSGRNNGSVGKYPGIFSGFSGRISQAVRLDRRLGCFLGKSISCCYGTFSLGGSGLHSLHLTLHGFGLIAHDLHLVRHRFITTYPSNSHLIQLAAHNGELPLENEVLRNRGSSSDGGEDGYPSGGSGGLFPSTIGGTLMIFVGSTLMAVRFKLADAPRNPVWLWVIAWTTGLVAFVVICQGTILILTGQWLL